MYPIKIKTSRNVLEEWEGAEWGSWEDHGCPDEGHVFNIIGRHKTVIEVRSEAEARLLLGSLSLSTLRIYISDQTAHRLEHQLKQAAKGVTCGRKENQRKKDLRPQARALIDGDMGHFKRVAKRWGTNLDQLEIIVRNSEGGWADASRVSVGARILERVAYHEYKRIADLKDIGSVYGLPGEWIYRIVAAHEFAHVIAQRLIRQGESRRVYDNHYQGWQEIYRECRSKVNAEIASAREPDACAP